VLELSTHRVRMLCYVLNLEAASWKEVWRRKGQDLPESADVQLQGSFAGSHAEQRISELVVAEDSVVILVWVACFRTSIPKSLNRPSSTWNGLLASELHYPAHRSSLGCLLFSRSSDPLHAHLALDPVAGHWHGRQECHTAQQSCLHAVTCDPHCPRGGWWYPCAVGRWRDGHM
jgi:hypothetical protein